MSAPTWSEVRGRIVQITVQDLSVAACGPDEAEQHSDGCCLSGTVGSNEAAHGPTRNGQIEAVDNSAIAEILRQSVRANNQHWCVRSSSLDARELKGVHDLTLRT